MEDRVVSLSLAEVKRIAELADLSLTDEEGQDYGRKLAETLDYVKILQSADTRKITPTAQVTRATNVFRQDAIEEERILPSKKKYSAKIVWR